MIAFESGAWKHFLQKNFGFIKSLSRNNVELEPSDMMISILL